MVFFDLIHSYIYKEHNPNAKKPRSCSKIWKSKAWNLSKNSNSENTFAGRFKAKFSSHCTPRTSSNLPGSKTSNITLGIIVQKSTFPLFFHNRVLTSMHFHGILIVDSYSLCDSEANPCVWLNFYAPYANLPLSFFRVAGITIWGFPPKKKLRLGTLTIKTSAFGRRRRHPRAQFMSVTGLFAIFP